MLSVAHDGASVYSPAAAGPTRQHSDKRTHSSKPHQLPFRTRSADKRQMDVASIRIFIVNQQSNCQPNYLHVESQRPIANVLEVERDPFYDVTARMQRPAIAVYLRPT